MSTRIFVIRHGETEVTQEDRFAGTGDWALSEVGRNHACGLATRLRGFRLDAVYSSPLRRALETATIVAEPHAVPVTPVEDLREINHGHWEGMTRAEVERQFPDEYAAYERDPLDFHATGGEPARAVAERAVPALLRIVRAHLNQQIALVSHKTTNRLMIGFLLGIDLRRYRDLLAQRPACLNTLDFATENQVMLSLLNDVSHYEICAPSDGEYLV
jgi:broad specificity phosphatase PhoE